jgi:predicted RND superfamily exporter protein
MTSIVRRFAEALTSHTRVVIAVLLFVTVVVGAGAPMVDDETDLQQFQGDSEAANASAFVDENFVAEGAENQTTVQVIRRGDDGENVFTRESFIESLRFQQEIRADPEIGPTLIDSGDPPAGADPRLAAENNNQMVGIGNVLALYELGRVAPSPGSNQTATLEFGALAAAENLSSVTFADLGITTIDDIPGGVPGGDTNPFDALSGIDSFAEFNEEYDSIGEVSLDRVRPEAVGFRDVDTLPPADCLASFEEAGLSPPLSCQIWALEEMDQTEFENAAAEMLGEDGELDALGLLPKGYEPGTTTATAHSMLITQQTEGGSVEGPSGFSENVTSAQLELQQLAEQQDDDYLVFGLAIVTDEVDQSLGDSSAIVGPVALLFVVVVLTIAYRDLLDILLGVAGILVVLLWTFGFMGWASISFNQLMISVPVLLIGLSIDYAIHVFMRHRERREENSGVRKSMTVALAGVGVALVWVTATAAIGFLSNLISPIGPLQDFGMASAFGILAALVVFGGLIPALKVELDELLERRGYDRQRRAFGTGQSRLSGALTAGTRAARRAPVAVLVLAILLSAGGAYGASQVDTSFQQEDFLADDPPEWTQSLPGPMAPGEYQIKQNLGFVQENYQQVGRQGELVVRGNVTSDEALRWMSTVGEEAESYETVFVLPNDQPDVRTPLTDMRVTAEANESFARSFENASTDGVPTENVSALYGAVLTRNPAASQSIYQTENGEYEAVRIQVGVAGDASPQEIASDMKQLADDLEAQSNGELEVVATGDPIINSEVEQNLFETVIESLLITLVAVFVFLAIAYRLTGSPASLGVVTLLPVLFSVTWILGTMWLIEMPFNALTGTITSLTIGLGIAYSIHISARYELELHRQEHVWDAMETTVTGTGGALLGSAATTVGGFGTLALAILPALRQFGIITGLTIVYAFLASILVLPALLVLWTRYLGPSGYFPGAGEETALSDGETAGTTAESTDD